MSQSPESSSDVARLRRWEDFGGVWRVVALSSDRASVALCRCDGGEEVERLDSTSPDLLAYLADRP